MPYSKRLVCLANSRKFSGRCVAGIEITKSGLGDWVRPVSDRPSEELSIEERRYDNGRDVQLLDIVEIRFLKARPHSCQQENHAIDDRFHWIRIGQFSAADLVPTAVKVGPLWVDGYNSYSGENDRIPLSIADKLPSSLVLVAPTKPKLIVARGFKKRQVRVEFNLKGVRYCLGVTDPHIETEYLGGADGTYSYGQKVLICVSLGEPFDGFRYKLAASLVPIG